MILYPWTSSRPLAFSLSRLRSAAAVCAVLTAFGQPATAANYQWDPAGNQSNGGGAGTWDLTSLFWNDDNTVPNVTWGNLADSVALFGGTGGLVTIDTGLGGTGVTANGLSFAVDGYTIGSDEASELLTLGGTTPSVEVTTGVATINSIIAGTSGLTKTGSGTLSLRSTAANTFTGPIAINAGTLDFQADDQLGAAGNGILLNGGRIDYTSATVDWTPSAGRVVTLGASGGTISSTRALRFSTAGLLSGSGTLTREAGGTTYALDIQQANIGFTGNTVVNSGAIEFRNNDALGNTAGQTVTVNGGIFSIAPFGSTFAPTLSHAVTLNGGSLAFNNLIGGRFAGNVNVTADSGVMVRDFYQNANRGGAIDGILSGTNRLTVTGATGTLVAGTPSVGSLLLRNPANTYSGTLSVEGGAHVRSLQGGGVDALASAVVELNGGGLGLAPVVTAAGANSGLFGRYYNSTKINNGVGGGFDWGVEPIAHTRNDATINYTSTPLAPGVNIINTGVLWTGVLEVTTPGTYSFSFRSDDGSMVYVDGQMVVANDFSQGPNERFGSVHLPTGFHSIILKYAQGTGGSAAQAFYNGPDTGDTKVALGSVANSITNNGAALFAPTTIDNPINVLTSGDIDLAGADSLSTGAITFSAGASLRVTGVTGFETLTQAGPVSLNGSNTISAGITLTNNQTATHGHNSSGADLVILGTISESSAGSGIIKDGPRKVTLGGLSLFTGTSTVNGGTLAGTTSTIPTGVLVNAGGTLEFDQSINGNFTHVIDGTGALRKSGTGTVSLNAANSFSGITTIAEGTLTGTGSLAGPVIVNAGATIRGSSDSMFTTGSITWEVSSRAHFALGAPSIMAPLLGVNGDVAAALASIDFSNAGGMDAGSYRLIGYTGTPLTMTQFAGFTVGNAPAGFYYGLVNNASQNVIDLEVETPNTIITWTGSVNGTWDAGTTANWSSGHFLATEQVVFANGPVSRNISGPAVSPQSITVNSSAGSDYTIGNSIIGMLAGGLQKSGTSTLRLTGTNFFSGAITVTGGTVSADVSTASSSLGYGAVNLAAGTVLQLNPVANTSSNGLLGRYFSTTPDGTTNGNGQLTNFNFSQTAGAIQLDTNYDPAAYSTTNQPVGGAVGFQEGTTANWKNFAIERTGKISITTPGWYGFHTFSDDGSRIFINGRLVANADGGHGNVESSGAVYLEAGLHDLRYEFAQGTGGADERMSYSGPGIPKQVIPSSILFTPETGDVNGSTNNVILGNPVTAEGSATIALNGTQFTGVEIGALVTNGGTLTVTGSAGKQLRSATTILNDSVTFAPTPDLALGKVTDLGSSVTVTKLGAGRLILDNITSGAGASTLSAGTVLDIQEGQVLVKGSSVAGSSNPLGLATVNLNGGNLLLDSVVGGYTLGNSFNALKSGTLATRNEGHTITLNGAISIAAGATLTLDVADGTRGSNANTTIPGQAVAGGTLNLTGGITGAGNLNITSTQSKFSQAPIVGSVFLRQAAAHTGLTTITGAFGSMFILDIRGAGSLLNTTGINKVGEIDLTGVRLNLHNNDGGNLANRIPDTMPITMRDSTIRFDGANGTSSTETIGPITLAGGQSNLFGGTVSGTAFHRLTSASITRLNRATLRIDGNNLGSLTAANGLRLLFTDSSGFTNNMVGGNSTTLTNTSIIPWVWGAPTGNNRTLVTYGTNGLRTLADEEYTTLALSTDATDNIRESFAAAGTIGSGATQTVNSFSANNTGGADATLALATGTTLNVTSGALMLTSSAGTARRVVLAGGTVDFGAAEGVIITSRREHAITSLLSGSNGLTITGDGSLTLNNSNNNFTGEITIATGGSPVTGSIGLFAQNDGSLGNLDNDILINGSSFRFNSSFSLNAGRTVIIGPSGAAIDTNNQSVGIDGIVTGPGSLYKTNNNTLALRNAANNYSGDTYIFTGNLVTNTGPQGDIHHYSADAGGFTGANRVLTFDQAFDGTYGGNIDGVGDVVKAGTGRVTFTGDHTYVGTTTVNAGALIVNGSLSGSTTTISAGLLGGVGELATNLIVGDNLGSLDATLSPGESIGTLTVGGNITFNLDAAFQLEINSGVLATDRVAAGGSINLGAGVAALNAFDLGPVTLFNGEVLTFLTAAGGISGEFLGLPDGSTLSVGTNEFTIDYTTNSVSLVAVPEPSSFLSLLGGLGLLVGVQRRRAQTRV